MTWHEERMACLDLETTGVDPETARIVTVAFGTVGGGDSSAMRELLVDPGVEIPAEATEVHGVTTDRARADGVAPAVALSRLARFVGYVVDHGLPLVVFNARYDLTVLDRELRRHGRDGLPEPIVIDPLVIDRHLDPWRKGKRTLAAQCEHWDCKLDGAHGAPADALAACRVAYRLGQRSTLVGAMTLPALHAAQRDWAHNAAVSLQDYFRRGNPAKNVSARPDAIVRSEWPMVPV